MSVIALVCEGPDDGRIVPTLVNRLVAEAVDWLRDQPHLLAWCGCEPATPYTTWTSLSRLGQRANQPVVPRRFGSGLPQREDAPDALRALLLLDRLPAEQRPIAVVLQRDDDRTHENRRAALELARDDRPWAFPVVVGVASPMIEAWVLAGFVPDDREQAAHADVCRQLGFDPCRHADQISPRHDDLSRRPKAVRERLTGNHLPRELACLAEPWPLLEAHGEQSGLTAFVADVRRYLIPRAFGTPPPG